MTPKEKAVELIDKMYDAMDIQDGDSWKSTKQCALIAVEEIIDNSPWILDIQQYWKEVKQEIEQL